MVCLMQMTKLILNAKLPMYSTKALPRNAPAVKYGNILAFQCNGNIINNFLQ